MLDLMIDLVNVIPDFFGAILFLIAAFILSKYCSAKTFRISACIFTVASLGAWIFMCYYAVRYPDVNIWSNMDAYTLFTYVNVFQIIKYISLGAVVITLFYTLKDIVLRHTGSPVDEFQSIAIVKKRQQKEALVLNIAVMVLGLICCVSGIARNILLYDFPEYSLFDIVFNIIYIFYLVKLLTNINDAVEYRYL
jgi:hypothetical protein